ncbi:hypothetical protein CAPTEDRAFT_208254 [Capitella teleta]|uniref:AP-5 complex subunit beta-1 n=1 Tax=Capitella teleta TaxID=283909 RepID=R7TXI4_CAPTE|nr:hypothetical protein CAPTEDRAFT_208254 [Capitella teleta]|eukprot:ELT96156.1 hypothetical protein CAPTEDRAFT_208254 [Capitella teleta]
MGKGIFDGTDWWREVVDFRKSPRTYLNSHGITEDDFVVDALQGLWNDKLGSNAKIHILMLLQEFSPMLLQSHSSIEQVIVSLQDVFRQRTKEEGTMLIQTHILLTITDISITHNCILNHTRLVLSHVEILLDVVRNINRVSDGHMRGKACACLLALEERFPGLLSTKLEHLSHMWTIEISSAGCVYLALFTTVLEHLIAKLATLQTRLPDNCLSNAMCNRTEPLLVLQPFYARFSGCQDLESYHTMIHLLHTLGIPSADSKDFLPLIKYLFACTTHTGLLPTQRKLACEFLKSFKYPKFSASISSSFLLSSLEDPWMTNFGVRCATIVCLCKLLIAQGKTESLNLVDKFRDLSHPMMKFYRFLVDLYKQYMEFTPYIINLTQATLSVLIESSNLIKSLLDDVTQQKKIFDDDLKFVLQILQAAAELKDVALHKLLYFVKTLLSEDEFTDAGNWSLGNQVLVVCRLLMQYHTPLPSVYGDMLHLLMTKYQDLDIRDRATLYYAMWTHLSPEKLIKVLSQLPSAVDNKMPAVMSTGTTQPNSILQMDDYILHLERKLSSERKCSNMPAGVMDSVADYLAFLDSEKSPTVVQFSFDLKLRENAAISEAFTVVLKFDPGENFHDIKDMCLYHLSSIPDSTHVLCSPILTTKPSKHIWNQSIWNSTIYSFLLTSHPNAPKINVGNLHKIWKPKFERPGESSVALPAFLPPRDHLFLHFKENKKGDTVCHITVSDVKYLPLVSEFITQFVQ